MAKAQPSLLRMWQARFKAQVAAYIKAKEEYDLLEERQNDAPDTAGAVDLHAAERKERLLRGVVRGSAQMLIILTNPASAKDMKAVADLEIDYGMPGKRNRPRVGTSPTVSKYLEDNRWI